MRCFRWPEISPACLADFAVEFLLGAAFRPPASLQFSCGMKFHGGWFRLGVRFPGEHNA
jgi:hypothetical protein